MLQIAYIFVEPGIYGHVFGSNCESFRMLCLVLDKQHEGKAGGIFGHHFANEANSEVHPFNYNRLVAHLISFNHFL